MAKWLVGVTDTRRPALWRWPTQCQPGTHRLSSLVVSGAKPWPVVAHLPASIAAKCGQGRRGAGSLGRNAGISGTYVGPGALLGQRGHEPPSDASCSLRGLGNHSGRSFRIAKTCETGRFQELIFVWSGNRLNPHVPGRRLKSRGERTVQ